MVKKFPFIHITMARKKKSSSSSSAAIADDVLHQNTPKEDVATVESSATKNGASSPADSNNTEEMEMVYLQVDTGDVVKLKQILDETVAGTLLEDQILPGSGSTGDVGGDNTGKTVNLEEDHKYNNMKLILMALACSFAMVAQFAPLPFPESRYILGGCCACYFALSGLCQLVVTYIDRDSILLTKPLNKQANNKNILAVNPKLAKYGLRVRTSIPRFSEYYSVTIEFEGYPTDDTKKVGGGSGEKNTTDASSVAASSSPFVVGTWSVGRFFDAEGMFDEYGLVQAVEGLYKRFEAGKFDDYDKAMAKEKKLQ